MIDGVTLKNLRISVKHHYLNRCLAGKRLCLSGVATGIDRNASNRSPIPAMLKPPPTLLVDDMSEIANVTGLDVMELPEV
jgi:hypothetical protein